LGYGRLLFLVWRAGNRSPYADSIRRAYAHPMNNQLDLRQLFQALGDAVIVADPNGIIVGWNAAASRIFGFSEAEAMGQNLTLIIPERLRHRHNVGFDKSMETGTTRYGSQLLKVPANHKDGGTLSIAFTVAMLFDENHKVTGVAAVIRDETARWLEERELKQRLASHEAKSAAVAQTSMPADAKA
jgi:PAS domain S-box-containing protein